ncbi:MAG: cytochrome c [Bryobacteraceae bacterium]|nr:cytochrome c [Bryobacteraceae bacterium]
MNTSNMFLIGVALAAGTAFAADVHPGKAPYDKACKSCHGISGAANPAIAKALKLEMRDLGSKEVQASSDSTLRDAITKGSGKMKPVPKVAASADDLVAYMRTFKK